MVGSGLGVTACDDDSGCRRVRVIGPDGGERLSVCAVVRDTAAGRRVGLRDVAVLPDDRGLLLVFPVEDEVCIVNDGVGYPIDVIHASTDGEVVAIERAIPAGDATARCHPATRQVLEVGAGVAARVMLGDRLDPAAVAADGSGPE